jgi:pimeloyl-ACP methyl ester carboxylesterase
MIWKWKVDNMPTAKVNDISLFYESVGDGPAVVYIHGGYGGAGTSVLPREEEWVHKFKDSYQVITYDRRSSGRSEYPDSEHTLDMFVDDLRGLIEQLKISKLFLIGSSAGGPIALKYSLKYQDTLIGLILPNTSARVWNHDGRMEATEELKRRYELFIENGSEKTFDLLQQADAGAKPFYLLNQGPNSRPPNTVQQFAARELETKRLTNALSREEKIKYYIGELRNQAAYIDSDLRGDLHDISTPTLILHGDADTQVPYDLGKELTLYIDGSEFVTIPDAGHGIMQWDQAISAIRKFCDGIAG